MRTEKHVKSMFNIALYAWINLKKEWEENGNNHHGHWYEERKDVLAGASATLNTLRQVLDYYGNEPFKLY